MSSTQLYYSAAYTALIEKKMPAFPGNFKDGIFKTYMTIQATLLYFSKCKYFWPYCRLSLPFETRLTGFPQGERNKGNILFHRKKLKVICGCLLCDFISTDSFQLGDFTRSETNVLWCIRPATKWHWCKVWRISFN